MSSVEIFNRNGVVARWNKDAAYSVHRETEGALTMYYSTEKEALAAAKRFARKAAPKADDREHTYWRARLETRHYSFEAYGFSEANAIATLKIGLRRHAVQCGISTTWFHAYEDDIHAYPINIEAAYRDHEELKP